jgi:hypothetical protein
MRYFLLAVIVLLSINCVWAKELGFSFDYPDSLKKNADIIVLLDKTSFTRSSKSNLKQETHFVVTILSDRGDAWAEFTLGYDKFSTISNLECTLYDSKGEKIRKLKSTDVRDYAAFDGFTLFSDNRLKHFEALNSSYPYTIELKYDTEHQGFMALPTWYGVSGYNVAVKEALVILKYPSDMPINYREKNIGTVQRKETDDKNLHEIQWKIQNIRAIESEKYSPNFADQVPLIFFSPNEFTFDKSEGVLEDWQSMGKWNYGLLETNYTLTEKTQQDLNQLKRKFTNKRDLVNQVYKYMQSKTRYVGIQLGIGGVKPFSPQLVDEVGYGDCKALSYYTKSLLQFVGIPSCYTIIGVNSRKIEFPDFPSINQMNHAILCVPTESDTIWLECTSQTAPFNHLFNGSTGRKALLVTAEGGKMVTTYKPEENRQKNSARVKIDAKGEILCDITTTSTGLFYDEDFGKLQLSDKELREELLNESPVSDISIVSAKVVQRDEIPELSVSKSFTTRNFVTKSGNRVFVELSPFMSLKRVTPQKSVRRNPVSLEETSVYEDQVTLELPAGFTLEFCPEGKTVESEFGHYQSKIEPANGQVVFHRTLIINKATYPKEKYYDFVSFINNAADADKCKVIMKNP